MNDLLTVRWAIIGPGSIANSFVNDLQLLPGNHRVQSVLGHHSDSTNQFAREFKVPEVFLDLDEFVNQSNADIVYIASPHPQHYKAALACLQNKIPVLCEKPLTLNAEECQKLINASIEYDTFLMDAMWIRFLPTIQRVIQFVSEGKIGNVLVVKAAMNYRAPSDPNSRYFDPAKGGGSLLDLGIYPIFLAYLLLGKPSSIKSIGSLTDKGVDEICSMLFKYDGGQQAMLQSSLVEGMNSPAEIIGDKGTIRILDPWFEKSAGIELEVYNEWKVIYSENWQGHGLQYEAAEVLKCLAEGKRESDQLPLSFSLDLLEIMDEIRKQIEVTYEMFE